MTVWMGDPSAPADEAAAVVNDVTFTTASRAIYCGVAGDIVVVMVGGGTVTFKNFPTGQWLPVRATKVTGATTATNLVALF